MSEGVKRGPLLSMIVGGAFISQTSVLVEFAHVPPTISAFWRMLLGGLMLSLALVVSQQWRAIRARDVLWMVVPAIAFAADLYVWHRSILIVGPGVATLLGNLQVFLMALAGVLLHRERLGWRFAAGLLFAFGGLWMLIGRDWSQAGGDYRIGVALGAFTAICYTIYMLSFRHAQKERSKLKSSQLLAISSLLCAGMLAVIAAASGDAFAIPDQQSWLALIGLGLVGQCLGWVFIARAMPLLPASLVGLLLLLQPILAFLSDVAFFHRPTQPMEWAGLVLSLCGIFVGSLRGKPASDRHEDLTGDAVE